MSHDQPREIGSREVAAMLQVNRATVNDRARRGQMPGLLRKEPGGYANRGRYVFDANVIEQLVRDRIQKLAAGLDETRAAS